MLAEAFQAKFVHGAAIASERVGRAITALNMPLQVADVEDVDSTVTATFVSYLYLVYDALKELGLDVSKHP